MTAVVSVCSLLLTFDCFLVSGQMAKFILEYNGAWQMSCKMPYELHCTAGITILLTFNDTLGFEKLCLAMLFHYAMLPSRAGAIL